MSSQSEVIIEFDKITKRFGSFVANRELSFQVMKGALHGVIGENGAGKSTAMKILYGMQAPDSGRMLIRGKEQRFRSPKDALTQRIGMVHQHFMLSGPETALENILLGAEPGFFKREAARTRLKTLAADYGLDVPWDTPVEDLPVGIQQRVEILKLLYRDADILILDEPTAVLTPQETDALFLQLRKLCAAGKTVLVITHKLREILSYTDSVTVFRRGEIVSTHPTPGSTAESLAEEMVGRSVLLAVSRPAQNTPGEVLLRLENLTLTSPGKARPVLDSCQLEVRAGEVVGIAGIEGNGQSDLLNLLIDPRDGGDSRERRKWTGSLQILGQSATNWTSLNLRQQRIAFVPEDRHRQGLLLDETLEQNFLLGLQRQSRFSRWGVFSRAPIVKEGREALDRWDVRPRDLDATARSLSGGNQQKWVLAREMAHDPKLIIVAQPTRGVDVGAIEMIHREILDRRDAGAGVLLISSELDEVLSLSDRVLVLYEGRIVGEFKKGTWDERTIGMAMTGGAV
jgi:ABC-type uncharacterized transport system ATPase subunit